MMDHIGGMSLITFSPHNNKVSNSSTDSGQLFGENMSANGDTVTHTHSNYSSCAACVQGFKEISSLWQHLQTHVNIPSNEMIDRCESLNEYSTSIEKNFTFKEKYEDPSTADIHEMYKSETILTESNHIDSNCSSSATGVESFAKTSDLDLLSHTEVLLNDKVKTEPMPTSDIQCMDPRTIQTQMMMYMNLDHHTKVHIEINPRGESHCEALYKQDINIELFGKQSIRQGRDSNKQGDCTILSTGENVHHQDLHGTKLDLGGVPTECVRSNISKRYFDCGEHFADKPVGYLGEHRMTHGSERIHTHPMGLIEGSNQCEHLQPHVIVPSSEYTAELGQKPYCDEQFPNLGTLRGHMPMHKTERPHSCSLCKKVLKGKKCLKIHMKTHTGEKRFQCSHCGKKFTQSGGLNVHVRTHTGEKPHQCSTCGKRFAQVASLKKHLMTHTGEKPHQCPTCSKQFSRSSSLKSHMITHTGEKAQQCPICGKYFVHASSLKPHMLTHTGEKPHKCSHCGKEFTQAIHLKGHMVTHTGEKHYTCSECDRKFGTPSQLHSHMISHTGEKPYKCPHCDDAFSRIGGLNVHIRTHTGEKPYECPDCKKAFVQHSALQRHKRTHTGEKPYICSLCGMKFTQSGSVKLHKSRAHPTEK